MKKTYQFAAAMMIALLLGCDAASKTLSSWVDCGLHVTVSNQKVMMMADVGRPKTADFRFPVEIDYPISLHLGAEAATVWSDTEFEIFSEQLPERLLSVGIYDQMPEDRLLMLRKSVKEIRDVKLIGDIHTDSMDRFLKHYHLTPANVSFGK